MADREKEKKEARSVDENVLAASASSEVVSRYGSASAEYIKGYVGVDQETGQKLSRSHKGVSSYKLNPDDPNKTIKQQAGFNAEIAKTAKDNAENIINKTGKRVSSTEDVGFGSNHPVYDHVELRDGMIIEGSGSQMKFVNSPDDLCRKIATGEGGGKADLSRYQGVKLDLPTEQVEATKAHCRQASESLNKQADRLEKDGKLDLATKKRLQAKNYDRIGENIRDSGLTRKEAIFYRKHPKLATTRDIAVTSHRAGIQAAKGAAVIQGCISIVQNGIAVVQDDKELGEALKDTAKTTAKTAGVAYTTGVVGSSVKGAMQQSSKSTVRALSKTNLPSMVVVSCLEAGRSFRKYINGEIDSVELCEELGEKGTGMVAGAAGATVGQLAIPIPVVGAVIGGMIGYTLSSLFYSEALCAFKAQKEADENYERVKRICRAACLEMEAYRLEMQTVFLENFKNAELFFEDGLKEMERAVECGDIDCFAVCANKFAVAVGGSLKYGSFAEFDGAMQADEKIII